MSGSRPISTMKLFTARTINQTGRIRSIPVDLREIGRAYNFSVTYSETGTGNVKIDYVVGPTKDGPYLRPAEAADIVSVANGKGFASFTPVLAPFIRIRVTENGVGVITSFDLWLHVQ